MLEDVPSPIDLRQPADAQQWAATALSKRPDRPEFFACFERSIGAGPCRVLELGSGPGFLAHHLLNALPSLDYVALDFSVAMHDLARERLGPLSQRVQFIQRSFKEGDWSQGLGQFDFVLTHQAVHELRHKRYAAALHRQVRTLLAPGGAYLVCDHFAGADGMSNDQLYMTADEQAAALADAGFASIEPLLCKGGMLLHRAN
ncbi:class I SAM-dependent methyltransferase [Roseateles oligotrophus]|uniref:Class I SAM-dependent methyltransferase n=1 Tax=Roseateles oligotrophus TaxID=1769250 RepID=A0ABT2YD14_9BURK|nr:class I SAM-dependent methyltransferase [Roseateles oligotrophus]MCV2367941.1 class I SAM-dependent methyltransferase [Roseateles oligotrophus]